MPNQGLLHCSSVTPIQDLPGPVPIEYCCVCFWVRQAKDERFSYASLPMNVFDNIVIAFATLPSCSQHCHHYNMPQRYHRTVV